MGDLSTAQATLDEKQAELDKVKAVYDNAMSQKQVKRLKILIACVGLICYS